MLNTLSTLEDSPVVITLKSGIYRAGTLQLDHIHRDINKRLEWDMEPVVFLDSTHKEGIWIAVSAIAMIETTKYPV